MAIKNLKRFDRYIAHYPIFLIMVDELLDSECGVTRGCLLDAPYRQMWEDGATPLEMAQHVLDLEFGSRAPSIVKD